MKILFLDNSSLTPVDGDMCCENKTGEFASELKSLGNKITMYGQVVDSKNTVHAYKLQKNGINVVGIKRKENKLINYFILYFFAIPSIIKADFVYVFYPSAFKYISFLCWLLRTPYGVYVRGEQGVESKTSKWIYRNAFVIFTVTDHFTQLINKITNKNTAYTIRPMIPLTEKNIVSNREYIHKEHYKILFLARLEADKGVKELLLAVAELKNNYSFSLDLVGSGGYLQQAKDLVKELDISEYVKIHGTVLNPNKVRQFYLDSDLYILPTYHEGFPRTLYEAMIFGAPIMTTFVGGIPSIMSNKYNCLEIKPKSVESIVNCITYAFDNYSSVAELTTNAIKTVLPIIQSSRQSHAEHLNTLMREF